MNANQLRYIINQYQQGTSLEQLLSDPDDCITIQLYGFLYNNPSLVEDALKCLESIWDGGDDHEH